MTLTKQQIYERKVALKIAELVTKDGVREGMREAYKQYEEAIEALSPDAQMYWYQNCYLPSKLQEEINGTEAEQRAMAEALAEAKLKGGQQ